MRIIFKPVQLKLKLSDEEERVVGIELQFKGEKRVSLSPHVPFIFTSRDRTGRNFYQRWSLVTVKRILIKKEYK